MKNIINYYYGIYPDKIINKYNSYIFNYNNNIYSLYEISSVNYIKEIYNLNIFLINNGVKVYEIIKTNNNDFFCNYNNKNYSLLKIDNNYNNRINIFDILNFTYINMKGSGNNWKELWINKNINLEYKYEINQKKYKSIKKEFYYYQGISLLAISLLDQIKIKNYSVQHRRVTKDTKCYYLYNPFNLIIDDRIRDLANYYKSVEYDLSIVNIYQDEWINFFIRYLYPTEFYDKFENDYIENEDINKHQEKIKKTYSKIMNMCILPNIDWLK